MKRLLAIALVCLVACGCASYYRVTDLNTGKDYYTRSLDRRGSGMVEFTDSRTGSEVTLPASKVTKINKEEFEYGGQRN